MGGWCGVCDGAAKGRRAKAAERATVPSSPSDSLAAHLTAAASQSQQQAAASRSAGCNSAALSCYAMPKALGKRPQSPGDTNYDDYNSAIVTTGLINGQWTSV